MPTHSISGLLARIHTYTVKRLRAEIEPVAPRDYLRFLFAWQHVSADERMEGPQAVNAIVKVLSEQFPDCVWLRYFGE
jgi:ATP-dependent helicase Lhr and Lhr-like helicase